MAVVVSAMGGKPKVTDLLLDSVSLAAAGNRAGSEVCACVCRILNLTLNICHAVPYPNIQLQVLSVHYEPPSKIRRVVRN